MLFAWITDPNAWLALGTLTLLEIVLGIDNIIFLSLVVAKLPTAQRAHARRIGLMGAMVMRLALLASIAWVVKLTNPLFTVLGQEISFRDLILLLGGLFLIWKASKEIHESIEGEEEGLKTNVHSFLGAIVQIMLLDIIFSLDSVITAVGMVDHLPVMMAAVIISIMLMLLASKPLTRFVNGHPTIIILCLSFLLMIGFSLVADGFGYHIPKGYLYAAIGFSVMIEALNQLSQFNRRRFLSAKAPLRKRTAEAVLRLLRGSHEPAELDAETASLVASNAAPKAIFNKQERMMIARVLAMGQRSVSSIMTSRHDIQHIDLAESPEEIMSRLDNNQHTRLIITENSEEPLGVVHVIELLKQALHGNSLDLRALIRQPLVFPEQLPLLPALEQFRTARTHFAFVVDEFGSVEGVVTLSDVMETIAGNLPNEGEGLDPRYDIQQNADGSWTANGHMPLDDLTMYLPLPLDEKREYNTLAGLLMEHLQHVPQQGEEVQIGDYLIRTLQVENHRVQKVQIVPPLAEDE